MRWVVKVYTVDEDYPYWYFVSARSKLDAEGLARLRAIEDGLSVLDLEAELYNFKVE